MGLKDILTIMRVPDGTNSRKSCFGGLGRCWHAVQKAEAINTLRDKFSENPKVQAVTLTILCSKLAMPSPPVKASYETVGGAEAISAPQSVTLQQD
jgi:hypothetical protein